MNVLIVDDHQTNRKLLRATLEAEGFASSEAKDGLEALAILQREPVDAIICDILMPNMDGYRLCHELRQSDKFYALPVLLYTSTYTSSTDRTLAMQMGADGYLTKPASAHEILAALNESVQKSRERRPAAAAEKGTNSVVLRQYNEVLIKKLEDKNADLQKALDSLRTTSAQLVQLNAGLERRVKERTAKLEAKNRELAEALAEVKELTGLLPICCSCKKIRDGQNYWHAVESYISRHTKAQFTHGICPECFAKEVKALERSQTHDPDKNKKSYSH